MVTKIGILRKLRIEKELLKTEGVKRIGLFGSFAKGSQTKNSDIDILVQFNNKDYGEQYFKVLFHLEGLFKKKIDLIPEETLRKELFYIKEEVEYV